jgi:hypothetical protein
MKWEKPVWAALCTGRADGSNPKYLARAKHAIPVMVGAPGAEAQNTVYALLQSNGWRELEIKSLKLLDEPFHSDVRLCVRVTRARSRKMVQS